MSMSCLHVVLLFLLFVVSVQTIAIDNGIQGVQLLCTETRVELHVTLRRSLFQPARIYVKGHNEDIRCQMTYAPTATHDALMFGVPLGDCAMQRANQIGHNAGTTYITTYIVSFHHVFITKVDRAFRLICNYGVTDSGGGHDVTQGLSVSMLPTSVIPQGNFGGISNCRYSLYLDRVGGAPIRHAVIGQKIVHLWTCDGLSPTQYLWVRSCSVSREYGTAVQLIDSRGCTIDPVAMSELEYGTQPYHRVIAHNHAYKFADYPTLLFKCAVSVCDSTVTRTCPFPDGTSFRPPLVCRRRQLADYKERESTLLKTLRDSPIEQTDGRFVFDLISEPLELVEIAEETPSKLAEGSSASTANQLDGISALLRRLDDAGKTVQSVANVDMFCVRGPTFYGVLIVTGFLMVFLILLTFFIVYHTRKADNDYVAKCTPVWLKYK